jgi:predicted O-methyltransferase YrrM
MRPPLLHQADLGWRNSTLAGALGLRPAIAQHSPAEGELMEKIAADKHSIVEIGVAEGGSAWHARRAMDPAGTLVLIDTYPRRFGINLSSIIARRLVSSVDRGTVVWRHERSDEASKTWSGGIDLLFIDGDHSYEAVRTDYEEWSPHVIPDGKMAFHDALTGAPWMDDSYGSARLVAELRERGDGWRLVDSADSLAVFERA